MNLLVVVAVVVGIAAAFFVLEVCRRAASGRRMERSIRALHGRGQARHVVDARSGRSRLTHDRLAIAARREAHSTGARRAS